MINVTKKNSLKVAIVIFVVCIIAIAAFSVLSDGSDARATDMKPGSSTITDRDDAIEIAEQVANWNSANQNKDQTPLLDSVTELTVAQYTDDVSDLGVTTLEPLLSGVSDDASVWVVAFSGAFSPQRCPAGVEPPIYSTIEVSLDSRDGSVISVSMHD